MQIIGKAFYLPACVLYALKETVYSVVNRVALEIFTTYHWVRQDDKAKEIENISSAIHALEHGEEARPFLENFYKHLKRPDDNTTEIKKTDLLQTLFAYRYDFLNLYRGLDDDRNQDVPYQIVNFLEPPGSEKRMPQQREPKGQLEPKKLFQEDK